jgi:[acyl-carrier-protein] S-malonyltransferase
MREALVVAWLFPGQGTQRVGMGRALCEASPAARAVFDTADAALGEAFSRLMFEGPAEQLTHTANAQPAILTASLAALAALREAQPELPLPQVAAGHSLGEYSALVASGALDFRRAVQLVRLRGEAMQRAVAAGEGAMAAIIGGDAAAVEQLCMDVRAELGGERVVSPANFNAPGQVVIAGHADAVERATVLAKDRRLKAIPLKVSAPFHCSLMAPAAAALDRALREIEFGAFRFPVISNVEALPNLDSARTRELLVKQVAGAVRWQETLEWMVSHGVETAWEIGPGQVLAGLAKRTAPSLAVQPAFEPSEVSVIAASSRRA